jgi:hypothetical protein
MAWPPRSPRQFCVFMDQACTQPISCTAPLFTAGVCNAVNFSNAFTSLPAGNFANVAFFPLTAALNLTLRTTICSSVRCCLIGKLGRRHPPLPAP